MTCLLGRAQINLALLSLRCAIANRFMNFRHREMGANNVVVCRIIVNYDLSIVNFSRGVGCILILTHVILLPYIIHKNKAQDYSWASVVAEKGFEPMTFGL